MIAEGNTLENFVDTVVERIANSTKRRVKGRYTYVIGNNGAGKSRALGMLAEYFKTARPERTVGCIASSIHDRFTYADHGNVKYMGSRNSTNAVFLAAIERQLGRFILQGMRLDRRRFKDLRDAVGMSLSFHLDAKSIDDLRLSIEKLTRDGERNYKRAEKYGLINTRSLSMLSRISAGNGEFEKLTAPQIDLLYRYLELNVGFSIKIDLDGKNSIDFGGLSTGEQNRLLLFSKILSVAKDGAIFLIDEPEISLHLHWQMEFHRTLEMLLSSLNKFHVVVATHSPIIISEAARIDPNNGADTVAVLRRRNSQSGKINYSGPGLGDVQFKLYSFSEVASHEQLVLRQFQTSPYQTREVSVEIAETVLSVAEGGKLKSDALRLLNELTEVVGLSEDAKAQIRAAIDLVREDLVTSIRAVG